MQTFTKDFREFCVTNQVIEKRMGFCASFEERKADGSLYYSSFYYSSCRNHSNKSTLRSAQFHKKDFYSFPDHRNQVSHFYSKLQVPLAFQF